LKKNKLTRKEIENALNGLSSNDQILWKETLELRQVFSLYLEYRKETEKFSKFVTSKAKEFEQQRSENKEGA
jgi:hypothetical protein|tara:strand:- start:363 stop:578 length:216 start_codon:yes stop_codon:yes gene_type:complete